MPPKRGRPPKQTLYDTPLSDTQSLRVTRDGTDYYITKSTDGKRDAAPHGYVKVNAGVSADKIMVKSAVTAEVAAAVVAAIQGEFRFTRASLLALRLYPDARHALRAPTFTPFTLRSSRPQVLLASLRLLQELLMLAHRLQVRSARIVHHTPRTRHVSWRYTRG